PVVVRLAVSQRIFREFSPTFGPTYIMITIFSIPKPFQDHIGVIQRNAIKSWLQLIPRCEIILFGNETGVMETAAEFGIKHVADIAMNEYGTPLLSDAFKRTQQIAQHRLLCYINGDI